MVFKLKLNKLLCINQYCKFNKLNLKIKNTLIYTLYRTDKYHDNHHFIRYLFIRALNYIILFCTGKKI